MCILQVNISSFRWYAFTNALIFVKWLKGYTGACLWEYFGWLIRTCELAFYNKKTNVLYRYGYVLVLFVFKNNTCISLKILNYQLNVYKQISKCIKFLSTLISNWQICMWYLVISNMPMLIIHLIFFGYFPALSQLIWCFVLC